MISRRDLIQASGALAAVTLTSHAESANSLPGPTKIRGKKLLDRGKPEVFSGSDLKYIGMPIGGCFAGTVYLGGDGQLWNWDIFNQVRLGAVDRKDTVFMGDNLNAMSGANYVDPVQQTSPFRQRFALKIGEREVKFGEIFFRGEYPVGKVQYRQADADLEMDLIAWSPFIPLDIEDSSFPATTMSFTVKNTGKEELKVRLSYSLENPVLIYSRKLRNDFKLTGEMTKQGGITFGAEEIKSSQSSRKEVIFVDWSDGAYGKWVVTGTAFGVSPQEVAKLPSYMGPVNAGTKFVVNTHQTRNGENVVEGDQHVGSLTSPEFEIERNFINLRIGGGAHKDKTCVNLWVEGKKIASLTGKNSNEMSWQSVNVEKHQGKKARVEIIDQETGGWGQISLGEVIFSDSPKSGKAVAELGDFGSFSVEVVERADKVTVTKDQAEIGKTITIRPGESGTVTFVVAWHFPNCHEGLPGQKHFYSKRWKDASAVSKELFTKYVPMKMFVEKWNEVWYDSTLPYWFLDRTFINTSILATRTCMRFDDGRFYFWEGVGCCAGTCTHVWGYAQAIARIFPTVEKYLREKIDFGMAFHEDTGAIDYRAEYARTVATDGQASCILRAYREHQMSKSNAFLKRNWTKIKKSMKHLIATDINRDGILEGAQYNTLDTAWYGEIAWISSLYIAALRACEAMATEMNDTIFSEECKKLAESGSNGMVKDLFNGEYFINKVDPKHPEANNTNIGCHIDQLYGQSWAMQVGLPRVVPQKESIRALKSLFKYSFYEDVWEYRRKNKAIPGGRWYAAPKEAGLIMCSFPKGGAAESVGKSADAWAVGYFNECMTGFEYQVANHMIAEGMLDEGLTIIRAIHERYHPSKRNPYNEIECSDHYGRAMASYGAFIALTGFQCHGPTGKYTINSPLKKGKFPMILPDGWGTYEIGKGFTYAFRWQWDTA
jgi:non-lysosomal glucosylceramidase